MLYSLGVLYFVLFTYISGSTLGKKIFRLKVVSVEDRKPTLLEVIYRETFGRFLAELLFSVGYLMAFFHAEKRGLHDRLSDTKVVECQKEVNVPKEPTIVEVKEEVEEPIVEVKEEAEEPKEETNEETNEGILL